MTSIWKSRIILGTAFVIVYLLTAAILLRFVDIDIAFMITMIVGGILLITFSLANYALIRKAALPPIKQHSALMLIPMTVGQALSFMVMGVNDLMRSDILRYVSFAPLIVGIVIGGVIAIRYRPVGESVSEPIPTLSAPQALGRLLIFIALMLMGVVVVLLIGMMLLTLLPNILIGPPN